MDDTNYYENMIAELRAERDALSAKLVQTEFDLKNASQAMCAYAKDAARYRLLRNGKQDWPSVYAKEGADDTGWFPVNGSDLDAAIDAALKDKP